MDKIYLCDDYLRIWQGNCYDTLSKLANKPEEKRKYRLVVASPLYYNYRHYSKNPREIGQNKPRDYFREIILGRMSTYRVYSALFTS
jgi:hypothetical protein